LCETFFILRRTEETYDHRSKLVFTHSNDILIMFKRILNFLDRVSKRIQISNFTKLSQVGAKLFHADRRTKLIVSFLNSARAPANRKAYLTQELDKKLSLR